MKSPSQRDLPAAKQSPIRRERPSGWLLSEDRLPRNRLQRRARLMSLAESARLVDRERRARDRNRRELRLVLQVIAPIAILAFGYFAVIAGPTVLLLTAGGFAVVFGGVPLLERLLSRQSSSNK